MNCVVMLGRLVADPEERHTNDGTEIAKFRIAVNRPSSRERGEERTDFFNVVCFGPTAGFVNRYLGKGDQVCVRGEMSVREYDDKDGIRQRWIEIKARQVEACGSRSDRDAEPSDPFGEESSDPLGPDPFNE